MELTAAERREITLAASELPGFIRSMPRLLTNYYVLRVSSGTVDERIVVHGFYGPGAIWIASDGELSLNHGLSIQRCSAYIRIVKMKLRWDVDAESSAFVYLDNCPCVRLEQLDIDGSGTSNKFGVHAICSMVGTTDCTVKNVGFAVSSTVSSVVSANNLTGSGNTVGGRVYRGGAILLGDSTPDLMGGASNLQQGGLIVGTNGTPL